MASRAVWKGQIRLSLVSIPVEIHSATRSGARVRFRQIHGPSGKRVRYEKTVPGVGPVKADDILKAKRRLFDLRMRKSQRLPFKSSEFKELRKFNEFRRFKESRRFREFGRFREIRKFRDV